MTEKPERRANLEKDLREKFLRFCPREPGDPSGFDHGSAKEILAWFDELAAEIDQLRSFENLCTIEQYFRVFFRQVPALLFVINSEGSVLFSAGEAIANLGSPGNGAPNGPIYDWCNDKPWALEAIREALSSSRKVAASGIFQDRRYEIHCVPLGGESAEERKFIGLVIDVTERVASELLKDQQIAAMEASIDGMAILDAGERFIFINEAHVKIYGYDSDAAMIGKSWEVLYDGPELDRFQRWIMPAFREAGHWRGEAIGKKKNGTLFPQEVSLSAVRGGGLVCVVRDISEQKKLERRRSLLVEYGTALSESADLDETLERVTQLPVQGFADVCLVRLSSSQSGNAQVRLASSQHGKLWKETDLEELKEYPFDELEEEEESPAFLQELSLVSRVVTPLRVRGTKTGCMVLLRSTDHREGLFNSTEQILASNMANRAALAIENAKLLREARGAVAIRENLMASVSHDLKNPLTAISINTELLARFGKTPLIGSQIRRITMNLKISVDRMSALIRQLLEFEKMRSGRLMLEKTRVNLDEFITELVTAFQPVCEKKGIRLEHHLDSEVKTFDCDRDRLMQVLSNLVANAVKFTEKGGKISIRIAQSLKSITFSISDTGVGIKREDLMHVFQLYWQSDRTAGQGSGLGLAIARGIVEAHGGRIWVESQPGIGSVFSFSIPYPKAPSRTAE